MKETFVPARKVKVSKVKEEKNPNFLFPIGGIVVACLILMVLTSTNGKKKVEIFKQVISQNISGLTERVKEEEFIIDLKKCVFCGNCSYYCSQKAIIMSSEYELAANDVKHLKLSYKIKKEVEEEEKNERND